MLIFSILLVSKILKSKSKMDTFYSKKENIQYRKDVHSPLVAVVINFLGFSFNLPINIVYFYIGNVTDYIFTLFLYAFYISYAFNFYFFISAHKFFRQDLFSMFKKITKRKEKTGIELLNEKVF